MMKRRGLPGYMSVEASLVIPMTLAIFVLVMESAFFLYDQCCLTQDIYVLAMKESVRKDKSGKMDAGTVLASSADQLGNKYFALASCGVDAAVDGKTIRVSGEASSRIFMLADLFGSPADWFRMKTECELRQKDPPLHIRQYIRGRELVREVSQPAGK